MDATEDADMRRFAAGQVVWVFTGETTSSFASLLAELRSCSRLPRRHVEEPQCVLAKQLRFRGNRDRNVRSGALPSSLIS